VPRSVDFFAISFLSVDSDVYNEVVGNMLGILSPESERTMIENSFSVAIPFVCRCRRTSPAAFVLAVFGPLVVMLGLASTVLADESPLRRGGSSGTVIDVPSELREILEVGGTPTSLQQMMELERQQQRVADRVAACTVNVAIGPAQGCGVIISPDGYVLTAAHVATRPGKNAIITFKDGRTATAVTLGLNRAVDAGLIKINDGQNEGRDWPHASIGLSETLRPGMWCVATGHPGGFDRNRGVVTRVGRILAVRPDALVTDCALIGGDSGGPLFDISGALIAVHSRIGNDVADNLHVPIDHYDATWDRLAKGEAWGFLPGFQPVLGVRGRQGAELAEVSVVVPGSPAEAAGFREGDIVERFGDLDITDFQSLRSGVEDTMPGERVWVWIRRGDKRLRLSVEIGRN
jgi:serine protease Do